ncbi:MAG: lysylphosphatidylglycerol synthase domain-containing protein [Burkholderiaceae bacterium]
MSQSPASVRQWLRRLSWLVVALAGFYFVRELVRRFSDIPPIEWGPATLAVFLLATLAIASTSVFIGLMWHLLLRDQSVRLPVGQAVLIVAISQIGKYLPGNVGHFAGRAVMGRSAGVPMGVTAGTLLIETAWTLAIGAGFAAMAFLFYLDASARLSLPSVGAAELVILTALLLFAPWIGIRLVNQIAPALSAKVGGGQPLAPPRLGTALSVSALMVTCFGLLGTALWMQATWFFHVQDAPWLAMTLLFTAAWLVGYVVPGAPGGLGVREAMMVLLLSPLVGSGTAVGLGVSMRLVTIAGDGLACLGGMIARRLLGNTPVPDSRRGGATGE